MSINEGPSPLQTTLEIVKREIGGALTANGKDDAARGLNVALRLAKAETALDIALAMVAHEDRPHCRSASRG